MRRSEMTIPPSRQDEKLGPVESGSEGRISRTCFRWESKAAAKSSTGKASPPCAILGSTPQRCTGEAYRAARSRNGVPEKVVVCERRKRLRLQSRRRSKTCFFGGKQGGCQKQHGEGIAPVRDIGQHAAALHRRGFIEPRRCTGVARIRDMERSLLRDEAAWL